MASQDELGKAKVVLTTFRAYKVDPATGTPLDGVWYISMVGCQGFVPRTINNAVRRRLMGVHAVPNCRAVIKHSALVHTH